MNLLNNIANNLLFTYNYLSIDKERSTDNLIYLKWKGNRAFQLFYIYKDDSINIHKDILGIDIDGGSYVALYINISSVEQIYNNLNNILYKFGNFIDYYHSG